MGSGSRDPARRGLPVSTRSISPQVDGPSFHPTGAVYRTSVRKPRFGRREKRGRPADTLLIRPDAYVAWAANVGEPAGAAVSGLQEALSK
ncbi:hypothetical protein [Mycolicibacterium sp.]|uniref:aromatic-ring hydroxylase C-terminal domain-containing protein n=1 Tax=Mycolicibacterium sp. TaxID=2320850 RepID=UPI00343636D1